MYICIMCVCMYYVCMYICIMCVCIYVCMYYVCMYIYVYIQGVSRLVDITAGGDILGLCDEPPGYPKLTNGH